MRLTDVAAGVPRRAAFLGALFAALVTLPGLGVGTLWDNSETAYGEVAREILIYHSPLVMHLNSEAWFVQPPLYFWLAAIFAKLFGVTALAMRLPSALATIAMGGAVGYATARIAGSRAGMYAAVILSTSLMQAIVGRLAIMDALLDLAVTAAILCWFRAFEPSRARFEGDDRRRSVALVAGAAAVALGTLAKGPVAPVIVVLVIAGWLAWERALRNAVVTPALRAWLMAAALFAVIALPWFVLLSLSVGAPAVGELIGHYTVGRYTGVIENQRGPWFYYFPVLVLGFFPWIAFVPVALLRAWQRANARDAAFTRLAIVWTVLPFVFFSVAQTKLPNYIALTLPALAIIVGLWFGSMSAGVDRRVAVFSAALVPLTVGCIAFAIIAFGRTNAIAISVVGSQLATLAVGMLAGSIATVAAIAEPRWRSQAPYVLAVTSLLLVLFIAFIAEPVAERLKPIPVMAAVINRERAAGDSVAIRGVSGGNGLIFYTGPGVIAIDPAVDQSYLRTICAANRAFVVTREGDLTQLAALTRRMQRDFTPLAKSGRTILIRIDGRRCSGLAIR